jgi:TRAP-type C4-dicarboxylate transport system substrate-binding protein
MEKRNRLTTYALPAKTRPNDQNEDLKRKEEDKMKTKRLMVLVGSICLVLVLAVPVLTTSAAPTQEKVYEWKFVHFTVPGSPTMKYVERFAEIVKKYSDGRIKISVFGGDTIVRNTDLPKAVADGIIQGAVIPVAYFAGTIPVANVYYALPMANRSLEDMLTITYERGAYALLQPVFAKQGVQWLGNDIYYGNYFWTKKRAKSLNDLKGFKIRAVGAMASFFQKLGVTPVSTPLLEGYMAIKLGTIDGFTSGIQAYWDEKQYEVAKYYYTPYIVQRLPFGYYFNLKVWNDLPDDLKAILELSVKEAAYWNSVVYEEAMQRRGFAGVKAAGCENIQFSPKDVEKMQSTAVEVWDDMAKKDEYCAKLVGIMKNYAREMGYMK